MVKVLQIILLVLLAFSCSEKHEVFTNSVKETNLKEGCYLINNQGDSIPTGVPVPITEHQMKAATPVKPKTIPLPVNLKTIQAHPHIHQAGVPKVVTVPQELKRFTPGENGLFYPDTLPVHKTEVPAFYSKPLPAAPLQMRDNAVTNVQYLSVEEGLSNNIVQCILEDSRGNLWFGSRDETLTRYDGQSLTFFHNSEVVPDHGFTHLSLLEDKNGHIWFGTRTGLGRYDGNNFTYFSNVDGFKYNGVTRLIEDRKGNIWFGTREWGVGRFDGYSFIHYTTKEGMSHNSVTSLLEDHRGHLWFGTEGGGLNRFDGNTFTHFSTEEGLCHNHINAILEDSQRRLWFGTNGGGVCRFEKDGNRGSFSHYTMREGLSSNLVLGLYEDSQGYLWIGTYYKSLNRFDGKTFTHFDDKNGMNSTNANVIIEDSYGNIWVGTDEGVHRFGIPMFMHYNTSLSYSVNDIDEDSQGNIWFGVSGSWPNGAIRYDGSTFGFFTGSDDGLDFLNVGIHALTVDSRGNLWLGSGNRGVAYFNPVNESGIMTQFDVGEGWGNYLISMMEDSQGHLWFGTLEGMAHYDGSYLISYIMPVGPGVEFNLAGPFTEDAEQRIWFGHLQYLGCLAPPVSTRHERDSFICFTKNEGMPHSLVVDMVNDKSGLWIATEGGLSHFNGKRFSNFTQEDGLVHNKVYSIVKDSAQNIWAGTQNGLSLLMPVESGKFNSSETGNRAYKIFNFGKADGLKQADFLYHSSFLDSKNRIWWGKSKGAMMLDLNQLRLPQKPPRVQLQYAEVKQQFIDYRKLTDTAYAQTISFGKTLSNAFDSVAPFYNYPLNLNLPYNLNHLTFHFSGIDWAAPHQLRYSYLLEGFDDDWSLPQPEPKTEYRNLPHGNYTLKVKAIGAAQIWSEPFEYTFTVQPPWWYTWWAYSLYAIAFLALLTGIFIYQRRRWHLQSRLEIEQEKAKRLKEMNRFKSRFYTNITHEFRTPLTVIKGMADQIESEKVKSIIHRNSDRLLSMVNQILDLSQMESNNLSVDLVQRDIIPYLQYLTESCHSLAEDKKLNLAFFSKEDSLVMDYDEVKIQYILTNLLSNAIKFTPEFGNVKVISAQVVEDSKPYLQLVVKDTGSGIPKDKLPHIFDRFYQVDGSATRKGEGSGIGLALVKELVQLLDGRIVVESEMGIGSSFLVYLPIRQNASVKAISAVTAQPITVVRDAAVSPDPRLASTAANGEKPLVLIVEDNADVAEYIVSCLENDYSLQTARNGKEGVERALESIPDVILCDVMMPEMDGFEVCRNLKRDRRTSHIPIVMLTAKAAQEDKVTGLGLGADAYLTKPFDKKELLVRLVNLASQSKLLRERLLAPASFPNRPGEPENKEAAFLKELHEIVESNLGNELFKTNRLCLDIAMSRTQLHRKLKALTGKSTAQYIRTVRLQKAKSLLENSDLPIGEIASQVGFKDFSHFSRSFSKAFGAKPSDIRN